MNIYDLYHQAACVPSDIWEHVPTLMRFARMSPHITEFGTRTGVSTAALLRGEPQTLRTYDLCRQPQVAQIEATAAAHGVTDFKFVDANTLTCKIEPTDFLFIDTLHTFDQVYGELSQHAGDVRKFIAIHDTTSYAEHGEIPGTRGVWEAVEEYFTSRFEWGLVDRWTNNNGLAIFWRRCWRS